MESSGTCIKDSPSSSNWLKFSPLAARECLIQDSVDERISGQCCLISFNTAPAVKQNMPEFQRNRQEAMYSLARSKEGFSTNLKTVLPSASMYPKPVSGEWGWMPKVTNLPCSASSVACMTACWNAAWLLIKWSAASTSNTASAPCSSKAVMAAAAIAGAVFRPKGSKM